MIRFRGAILLMSASLVVAWSNPSFAQNKKKAAAAASDTPSPALERALKLYEANEFYLASIELYKVVEGESGDSEANKQKAEFWMGKTLYKLKFYSSALTYFDRIVQK